jgi:hypothetical protein
LRVSFSGALRVLQSDTVDTLMLVGLLKINMHDFEAPQVRDDVLLLFYFETFHIAPSRLACVDARSVMNCVCLNAGPLQSPNQQY